VPRFDSLTDTDLYGARVSFRAHTLRWLRGWTANSDVANRLRRLRKLAEESNNHDFERNLYIEERKAERGIYFVQHLSDGLTGVRDEWRQVVDLRSSFLFVLFTCWRVVIMISRLVTHTVWIGILFAYWLLADYGRSFLRPAIALVISVFLFHAVYWIAMPASSAPDFWQRIVAGMSHAVAWPTVDDTQYVRAVRAFSIANAIPFVGALTLDGKVKELLICGNLTIDTNKASGQDIVPCIQIPSLRFQVLASVQVIFSSLCIFFIALALRNYFRMR
jgi:hypothetical protein